ncbi:hypothetical protein ACIHFC_08675 [Streptomyces sp. NPDC052013]|uniref:Rv1733c family protein n=1 Tax=Streptomyces sp. NPDC052013 TaxID=3365679 RepID=UPI0037D7D875
MRTPVCGRPWRHSPLRRRSDVVEAWTVMIVTVLLGVGAPLVGLAAAWWAHDEARATVSEQRAERHRVRAEVVGRPAMARPQAGGQQALRAAVRWTEPGQQAQRTAVARIPVDVRQGDTIHLWVDSRGRTVPPPADGASVWQHSVGIGIWAAGGTAAVVLLVHRGVRGVALRRRLAEWERAWARTEPRWTHRGV